MIIPGDRVCVGFSGGADSLLLLQLFLELRQELQIEVGAVHVNHMLRGDESDGDQRFAEAFCRKAGIPLEICHRDVKTIAAKAGLGLEEAGRNERRRIFDQCIRSGWTKIGLAHHQNDMAETMLFNLARGSSLAGLASIPPVNGSIIRPLLCLSREEIEAELKSRDLVWRTDSSNLENDYARNRIRSGILPILREQINRRSVDHICAAAEDIREADTFLRQLAGERVRDMVEIVDRADTDTDADISGDTGSDMTGNTRKDPVSATIRLDETAFLSCPEILQRYVLMDVLSRLRGGRKDLTRDHLASLSELMHLETGKRLNLPGGIRAEKTYGGILLNKMKAEQNTTAERQDPAGTGEIELSGEGTFSLNGVQIICHLEKNPVSPGEIPEKKYTKWMDYDRIKCGLVFRTRRSGDYIVINREGGRKKLKDYLIDRKIPAAERDRVLLLASGSRVFWVVGYRISEDCKISEATTSVIQIRVTGRNCNE